MGFNTKQDNFDLNSYVKVNDRLTAFWTKYPDGAIETKAVVQSEVLVVEAKVYRTENSLRPIGTGHAFLTSLNGEKVGEFTETVAVGRALAMAGFQVEKSIASAEEMKRFSDMKNVANTSPSGDHTEEGSLPPQEAPLPTKLKASTSFSKDKILTRRPG